MDGKIILSKNEHGAYEVDIIGLLYLLKHKKVPLHATVIGCMKPTNDTFIYLDTYTVEYSMMSTDYVLHVSEKTMDENIKDLSKLPDFNVMEYDLTEQLDLDELNDLTSELPFDDELPPSPYLELDDMMVQATYLIYPENLDINKRQEPASYKSIHYEEALHRLKNGESVYSKPKNTDDYVLVEPDVKLTPEAIILNDWAIGDTLALEDVENNETETEDDFEALDDLSQRLADHLYETNDEDEDYDTLKHDIHTELLLNLLKDLLKED